MLTVTPLDGMPMIKPGDDLARLLIDALERHQLTPKPHDILVVTQKIVSKAEGRFVDLSTVTPSPRALELATITHKDARLVEVVLAQSEAKLLVRHLFILLSVSRVLFVNKSI